MVARALFLAGCVLTTQAACPSPPGRGGPAPVHALRAVQLLGPGGRQGRVAVNGQLLPVGGEAVPYRYRGERRLGLARQGRLLLVNGEVVGVDLTGADTAEALRWLPRVKRLALVVWRDLAAIDPQVVAALARLEARQPVVVLGEALTARGPLDLRALAPLCPVLHGLVLEGEATPAGLRWLARCTGLRALALRAALPAGGLEAVGALRGLRFLDLAGALRAFGPGPQGLSPLGELPGLVALDLGDNGLTDDELGVLTGLRGLHWLRLAGNPLSGATLGALGRLPRLRWLDVGRTRLTSAGLARLTALRSLGWLGLGGTGVTDRGRRAFQRARPRVVLLGEGGAPLPRATPPARKGPARRVRALGRLGGVVGRSPGIALGITGGALGVPACDQYLVLMRCYVGSLSRAGLATGLRALRTIEQNFRQQLARGGAGARKTLTQTCTKLQLYLRQSLGRLPAARRCLRRHP